MLIPKKKIGLALIVRNEEAGIREIVPKICRETFDDIFAIDGNSTDGTVAVLNELGVPAYAQNGPGLGAAMIDARHRASTDAIVFFHPDGNEAAEDLPKMVELLRAGRDFVVASRMIPGAVNEDDHKLLKIRKWANNGLALLANLLFAHGGNRTSDVTNGFRGISCAAWDRMRLTSADLTMDYQMVIRALKLGIPITEFPTHEGLRIAGATNFASFSTGVAELKLIWRELMLGRRNVGADEELATAAAQSV